MLDARFDPSQVCLTSPTAPGYPHVGAQYTMKKDDTLFALVQKCGVDVQQVLGMNAKFAQDATKIPVGEVINVPVTTCTGKLQKRHDGPMGGEWQHDDKSCSLNTVEPTKTYCPSPEKYKLVDKDTLWDLAHACAILG